MSIWTSEAVETTLEIEIGERALSWAYDINLFEYEPEAFSFIPGIDEERAEALLERLVTA